MAMNAVYSGVRHKKPAVTQVCLLDQNGQMVEAAGIAQAIPGLRPALARGASFAVRSGSCLAVEPVFFCEEIRFSPPPPPPNKKGPRGPELFGGGGGNRTRVRKSYVPGSTCLARCLVSSCGNTTCKHVDPGT